MTTPVTKKWSEATAYCANLTLAGYDDWRLPSRMELIGLLDLGRHEPAYDPVFIPASGDYHWAAERYQRDTAWSWAVDFGYGQVARYPQFYVINVRCVRGGI